MSCSFIIRVALAAWWAMDRDQVWIIWRSITARIPAMAVATRISISVNPASPRAPCFINLPIIGSPRERPPDLAPGHRSAEPPHVRRADRAPGSRPDRPHLETGPGPPGLAPA